MPLSDTIADVEKRTRKPIGRHVRRAANDREPISIQDRDREVIRLLGNYRLAWSTDLVSVLEHKGYSKQGTERRLRRLYDNGFLDVVNRQPNDHYRGPGSLPRVFGLGDRGAELFYEMTGQTAPKVSWRAKNRDIKDDPVDHRLLISSTMIAFECSALKNGGTFRIVPPYELLQMQQVSPELSQRKQPFEWNIVVDFRGRIVLPVCPDYVFCIERSDLKKMLFMLEADNKTEVQIPKTRNALRKATVFSKNLGYTATLNDERHPNKFGFHRGFTVLWVTSGHDERKGNIAYNARISCDGNERALGNFLVTTSQAVRSADDALDVLWLTAADEEITLRF